MKTRLLVLLCTILLALPSIISYPDYHNVDSNISIVNVGEDILFYSYWNTTKNLSSSVFSWNWTGNFINDSPELFIDWNISREDSNNQSIYHVSSAYQTWEISYIYGYDGNWSSYVVPHYGSHIRQSITEEYRITNDIINLIFYGKALGEGLYHAGEYWDCEVDFEFFNSTKGNWSQLIYENTSSPTTYVVEIPLHNLKQESGNYTFDVRWEGEANGGHCISYLYETNISYTMAPKYSWVNETKTINSSMEGLTIGWKIYVNGSGFNETPIQTFYVNITKGESFGYTPSYSSGDIPLITADAIVEGGVQVFNWIPFIVFFLLLAFLATIYTIIKEKLG